MFRIEEKAKQENQQKQPVQFAACMCHVSCLAYSSILKMEAMFLRNVG
jgi:hypothetical protein